MPRDGKKTRTRILDETTQLVLRNGFAGTTIDHILEKTQLTKGAFFYHFKSKGELAMDLMEHFVKTDHGELAKALEATAAYQNDPRERLFQFIQYWIEIFSDLDAPPPGCLYASYVYEPDQFGEEVTDLVEESHIRWRKAIAELINAAAKESRAQIEPDIDALANQFSVILEGAFIVAKALKDPTLTGRQLVQYKNYLRLIFREKTTL